MTKYSELPAVTVIEAKHNYAYSNVLSCRGYLFIFHFCCQSNMAMTCYWSGANVTACTVTQYHNKHSYCFYWLSHRLCCHDHLDNYVRASSALFIVQL